MDNPYVRLTEEFNHPDAVAEAARDRPLLAHLAGGRDEIERRLDEERRMLMRANEERLARYVRAAERWSAEWPPLSKRLVGLPLTEAHPLMVARAAELLPPEP